MSSQDREMPAHGSHPSSSSQDDVQQSSKGQSTEEQKPKSPSKIKQLWAKLGLDLPTVLVMMKAAIPPTVAIAAFEADAFAAEYTTLGYLVAITSILGFCIMPRAKFFQTMLLNLMALCIGAAMALLSIYTGIKARQHTTPPGAPIAGYNSSASAVLAIWLFFQVYLVNALKSAMPQFAFPSIIYAIFAIIAAVYGPQFPTTAIMESFVRRLMLSFLTGFGLAAATAILILPTTTRMVVFKKYTGYLMGVRGLMKAQNAYLKAMQTHDMFLGDEDSTSAEMLDEKYQSKDAKSAKPPLNSEANAYRQAIAAVTGLQAGLAGDISFAKRELAYGKLDGTDIGKIHRLLQRISLPLLGISSIIDIFQRIGHAQEWDKIKNRGDLSDVKVRQETQAVKEWQSIMTLIDKPFNDITTVMDQALQHVLYRLELQKPPKEHKTGDNSKKGFFGFRKKSTAADVEKCDEPSKSAEENSDHSCKPGTDQFADYLRGKCKEFWLGRGKTLETWCSENNIDLSPSAIQAHLTKLTDADQDEISEHERDQRQLFSILYMEYLLWSAAQAILQLVEFADSKHSDGTMKKKRIVGPNFKRLRKWAASIFSGSDGAPAEDHKAMSSDAPTSEVYLGDAFRARRDPEHLPPTNLIEKLGDYLRIIPRLLRSEHSVFGFRAACATMSIGIIAYLQDTYTFFIQQRLVWAMIMIAFSMTRSTGESSFTFLMRILGTVIAMIASYVIYYIVDGKTPGVIVFLFIWLSMCFYVVLKHPRFVIVGILSGVTAVLVIGYELQVRKIGLQAATSNGQPYYPVYELAPYRLACVAGGLFVAYFWTIFPYPTSEHTQLRRELGVTMGLLAHFYTVCRETIAARIRGDTGDSQIKGTPGHALEKARIAAITKLFGLVSHLKTSSEYTRWQIHVGGRFPKETYDALIARAERILRYTALVTFASGTFSDADDIPPVSANDTENQRMKRKIQQSAWLSDFRALLSSTTATSNEITALLSLLSSSLTNATPLPPYLKPPRRFGLVRRLEQLDPSILSQAHITEPGYAAFAVMTIATRSIVWELDGVIEDVKKLVGELDFSFKVVESESSSSGSSDGEDPLKGKKD